MVGAGAPGGICGPKPSRNAESRRIGSDRRYHPPAAPGHWRRSAGTDWPDRPTLSDRPRLGGRLAARLVLAGHDRSPPKGRGSSALGGRTYQDSGSTRIARPTRALLDVTAHPDWGMTLAEVARAIATGAKRPGFVDDLATDTARYGNATVARRLGLLIERIVGTEAARPFLPLRGSSNAAVPFVVGARSTSGPIESKWRVRVNADLDVVLERTAASVGE